MYIHARDRFDNPRITGDDLFAMDPLFDSTFTAEITYDQTNDEFCVRSEDPFEDCIHETGCKLTRDYVRGEECDLATYTVRFWWLAQYAQSYEVCPRDSAETPPDQLFGCLDRPAPAGYASWDDYQEDDRIVSAPTIFMRPNEGSPFTSPADSSCVCLNNLGDDTACSLRTGVAGELAPPVESMTTGKAKRKSRDLEDLES